MLIDAFDFDQMSKIPLIVRRKKMEISKTMNDQVEQTSDTASPSVVSLEFPNRLFFLFVFDLGKYVTIAVNEDNFL